MINVHKIKQIEDSRRRVKKEIYTKIYEQFCRKIQNAVAANQKQVMVQVPSFLLGYPSYDIEKAASYLKRQLELGGFAVNPISTINFHVSWHISKSSKPPPVQQQMVPEPPTFDEGFPSLINLTKAANKYR